ncbi:MAG: hypothetical protein KBE65_08060 [Phycisphaerae bacterium]|nr:hypothetical protein [Phycisphaerae bacterium]
MAWVVATAGMGAEPQAAPSVDLSDSVEIDEVQLTCRIDGSQLDVTVAFEARTKQANRTILLVRGDAVLEKLEPAMTSGQLDYDPNDRVYRVAWSGSGRHAVAATFVARGTEDPNSPWRQASLEVPGGRLRRIRLLSSQPDLEVELPGAVRVQRRIEGGQLVMEALLGPRSPLQIRWKPQVQLADARLVLSSQANTIVDVRAGLVQVDTLFDFQIAQGKLETLTFNVPADLSITAVRGPSIRTWTLGEPADGVRALRVELSRQQDREYRLQILAERAIGSLPATVPIPTIEPTGDLRAGGHLAVGTNSALQLVVQESSGLTQIDAAVFPHVQAQDAPARTIPQGKAFFYTYAGSRYRLALLVDAIVPTYEVAGRVIARVKEDDLVVDAELELDIRDAPLRQLEIAAPASLVVAAVDGNQVSDYHLPEGPSTGQQTSVRVVFKEPVAGRTLLHLRMELGRGPLDERQEIPSLRVIGAKTQRGYVVVAAETGIEIEQPQIGNLSEVHTASVPLRVPGAQYAYRFRDVDWTLGLMARRRPAEVRAEVFHLQSVGEALAYGSATVNYIITGSPIDELKFRLPESFENVEFVGRDVRRWDHQGDTWTVKLNQKVLGDYCLAATYTQRHAPDRPILLGALHCLGVQTQTGYVVVTSHLDLKLQLQEPAPLLTIAMDEMPGDYRLLTSSPILAVYKYIAEPHSATLTIEPYQRSELLPVVVDIADLQTTLAIRPDGRIESVTTVRYKVKNTTGQFLALQMPADARVWAVSQVESSPGGAEQSVRLAVSHDQASGRLLVPLRRQANPNDPATVLLEYGQAHPAGTWWKRTVDLAAPSCTVPIAYAGWRIVVPDRWAISPAGGNMEALPRPQGRMGLAGWIDRLVPSWERGIRRALADDALTVFLAAAAILVIVCAIVRRRHVPDLVVLALLVVLVWVGAKAWMAEMAPVPAMTSLSYAQAVSADPDDAFRVSTQLVPAWRQTLRISDMAAVAIVLVVTGILAWRFRRLHRAALAAIVAASIYMAAQIPAAWPVLKALATWGLPAMAAAWFAYRAWRRRPAALARVVPVASVLLMVCLASGCSQLGSARRPVAAGSLVERVQCSLTAGTDNMEIKYRLRVRADRSWRFPLVEESAVLVSSVKPDAHVSLATENGRHIVRVQEAGLYDVEADFLAALPPAGQDQQRRFELALPVALTNRVDLVIPDVNVSVEAPQAVWLTTSQADGQTRVEAMFTPGQPAVFAWRPLERQAAREEVRFYARDFALAAISPGLLQVFHEIRLQIAQGQVDRLALEVGPGQTVTSVNGSWIGAWRFDPTGHGLEVRLTQPVTGSYTMTVTTQSVSAAAPYEVRLEPLVVGQALDQHSVVGVAAEPSVYLVVDQHPTPMNLADYVSEVGSIAKAVPGLGVEQISHAFRFESPSGTVTGRVQAVQSEVRSQETARFNVEDDRLVYNSQWGIEIAKAGRFDVDLLMPAGFDIDALEAQEVSHWDESTEAGQRRVRVHFKHRLTGVVQLKLALSQAVAEVPDRLTAPRVTVVGGIKHTGCLVVGSEQGVRLSVASRQGVSEVNPAELGHAAQGLLAFQFLRPDWQIQLQTELIQARITVQSLHIARVTDGLVRHQHALRYRLYHAGTKAFSLVLPTEALGVTITGPGIARREQLSPGQWRIELADKVYDQPYLMNVNYETRYDPTDGNVPLVPVRCQDADLQQGYVAVFATERVELAADSTDATLRSADARSIPEYFGAGDLSGAAMCYRSISAQYALTVQARRHAAAGQIGAEVLRTDLVSVVTAAGQTINRVILTLRVEGQRHLQTILPEGAAIWSLTVDGQAVQPSLRAGADGRTSLLVPLPQQTSDDVRVDMVYVADLPSAGAGARPADWSGRHSLQGPRFDLPLKNITWQVYMPQGFAYGDFDGTLTIDQRVARAGHVSRYDMQAYQQQILTINRQNEMVAQQQQTLAQELKQKGEQGAARQALTKGYNFSIGNTALNEDIRVDLDNLVRQQAKVGLINARGRLRRQSGAAPEGQVANVLPSDAPVLSQQQVERIENSLGQADNENLELITRRIIQTQAAAETSVSQIQVTMPACGQVLRFDSPLQVEPTAEMAISFTARPKQLAKVDPSLWYGLGLFAILLACSFMLSRMHGPWVRLCAALTPVARSVPPVTPVGAEKPANDDDQNRQVSTEDLL